MGAIAKIALAVASFDVSHVAQVSQEIRSSSFCPSRGGEIAQVGHTAGASFSGWLSKFAMKRLLILPLLPAALSAALLRPANS